MSPKIPTYDINREPFMTQVPDFNRKSKLQQTERSYPSRIIATIPLTPTEKLFQIQILDRKLRESFSFLPGQFVMLELPGCGEIAVGIASSTLNHEFIEVCIRKVGKVTNMIHRLEPDAMVGLRGPFGTSFPMQAMTGMNVLLIAGGLGITTMRSSIYWAIEHRPDFDEVILFYGARDPQQLLFSYQFEEWRKISNLDVRTIVEQQDDQWTGPTGVITALFDDVSIDPDNTFAIVCGPPVMFKFVCAHLSELGLPRQRMFVSLERRMHCGMGKCCRCNVGSTFTCLDGPVFDYWSVMNLQEAI